MTLHCGVFTQENEFVWRERPRVVCKCYVSAGIWHQSETRCVRQIDFQLQREPVVLLRESAPELWD